MVFNCNSFPTKAIRKHTMAEDKKRVQKRIIIEDEEESHGEKENAGDGEKENAVAKIMKRFTPSTEWTDSGLGCVSLKGGDKVYLQVRVVTPGSFTF